MKLPFDRQQLFKDESPLCAPSSVKVTVTPHTHDNEYVVDVKSNIQKKSTLSALLQAVGKMVPHLTSRGIKTSRKLMTASVKNKTLWDTVPEGEEMEQRITFKRVGDRVRVTTYANVSPDSVQASWNVICPVMTPRMQGNESEEEICVVADTNEGPSSFRGA